MNINPEYTTIGSLFSHKFLFFVPKYQRGYAWGELQVDDFLADIAACVASRATGSSQTHFFGGIVSVESNVSGAAHLRKYELVDGQQRIATAVMLMICVRDAYKSILEDPSITKTSDEENLLRKRTDTLGEMYIALEEEFNRELKTVRKLELSNRDDQFYYNTIKGIEPVEVADSHKRISAAYSKIKKFVEGLVTSASSTSAAMDMLKNVETVIDKDCTLIHVITYSKTDAYRLFQVLNNRGIGLTEGDLLRARTLELLDSPGLIAQQSSLETIWDTTLVDPPQQTEDFLRWIYASYVGKRPGASTLFEDVLDYFYPQHKKKSITQKDADQIVKTTHQLQEDFRKCRALVQGHWPFIDTDASISDWHRNRLKVLVKGLGHTNCLPLLLAATHLKQADFYYVVDLTERFFFKYKLISNLHIGSLNNVYQSEAVAIRKNAKSYKVSSFQKELQNLEAQKGLDSVFESLLPKQLMYSPGAGNKSVRYFLVTVEYFLEWFNKGPKGTPKCYDTSVIYDFEVVSIEHIYPRNAKPPVKDAALDPHVNRVGNLTVLSNRDNAAVGNKSFASKKAVFLKSPLFLNRQIGQYATWGSREIDQREAFLISVAKSVFSF